MKYGKGLRGCALGASLRHFSSERQSHADEMGKNSFLQSIIDRCPLGHEIISLCAFDFEFNILNAHN